MFVKCICMFMKYSLNFFIYQGAVVIFLWNFFTFKTCAFKNNKVKSFNQHKIRIMLNKIKIKFYILCQLFFFNLKFDFITFIIIFSSHFGFYLVSCSVHIFGQLNFIYFYRCLLFLSFIEFIPYPVFMHLKIQH